MKLTSFRFNSLSTNEAWQLKKSKQDILLQLGRFDLPITPTMINCLSELSSSLKSKVSQKKPKFSK